MILFIKDFQLYNIRKKLIILYILNVVDMIFTLLLLNTGYFVEANFFMINVVKSPLASFFLKVIFPAFLLFVLYKRISKCKDISLLKASNIGINISLGIYTVVNITHLIWTALLPVFKYKY